MNTELNRLGDRIVEHVTHISAATHRLLADLRSFDAQGGWFKEGMSSCAHWLTWRVGWSLVTAREHVRVARRLGELAATDDALRRGEICYSKVRAIVRVATAENEPLLLEAARFSTGEELEKLARKYAAVQAYCKGRSPRDDLHRRSVRKRDTHDGMVRIEAVLDPAEAEMIWALLDQRAKQLKATPTATPSAGDSAESGAAADASVVWQPGVLPHRESAHLRAFSRADALMSIAQDALRGHHPNRAPIDVMITIPLADLRSDTVDPTKVGCIGRSCISTDTARRLACDAGIIEVIEDEHGVPLSVGRKQRSIAGSIKRALLKRDTTCTYPGCTHSLYLEGHHIQHWAHGGETSLTNCLLLCSFHHKFLHEHGYRVSLDAAQRPEFRDPQDNLVPAVSPLPTLPELGWPRILADNADLDITADTMACGWIGKPMRYGDVVSCLVTVDGLH